MSEIVWVDRTMFVTADCVEDARILASTLTGPAGTGMWERALSANGQLPATHYLSAGMIDEQFANLLPLTTITETEKYGPVVTTRLGNPEALAYLAAQAGLEVSAARVAEILESADVSEQDPYAAMARLGVMFVQEEAL